MKDLNYNILHLIYGLLVKLKPAAVAFSLPHCAEFGNSTGLSMPAEIHTNNHGHESAPIISRISL